MRVTGEGRIRESITRRQKAASVASVGSVCDLSLKIPGTHCHTLLRSDELSVTGQGAVCKLNNKLSESRKNSVQHRQSSSFTYYISSLSFTLPQLSILLYFFFHLVAFCPNQLPLFLPFFSFSSFSALYSSSITLFYLFSVSRPPLFSALPPVSWFLLVLSRQLLSHTSFRSYCSLWWSGRSSGPRAPSSAALHNQSLSPRRVRLISGLSGVVLAGGTRAARGVWVVDARRSVGTSRVEGALQSTSK